MMFTAELVADLCNKPAGVPHISEFMRAVQCCRTEDNVVMERGLSRMIFIAPFMHTSNNDTYLYDDAELDVCNGFQYRYHESAPHREGV